MSTLTNPTKASTEKPLGYRSFKKVTLSLLDAVEGFFIRLFLTCLALMLALGFLFAVENFSNHDDLEEYARAQLELAIDEQRGQENPAAETLYEVNALRFTVQHEQLIAINELREQAAELLPGDEISIDYPNQTEIFSITGGTWAQSQDIKDEALRQLRSTRLNGLSAERRAELENMVEPQPDFFVSNAGKLLIAILGIGLLTPEIMFAGYRLKHLGKNLVPEKHRPSKKDKTTLQDALEEYKSEMELLQKDSPPWLIFRDLCALQSRLIKRRGLTLLELDQVQATKAALTAELSHYSLQDYLKEDPDSARLQEVDQAQATLKRLRDQRDNMHEVDRADHLI